MIRKRNSRRSKKEVIIVTGSAGRIGASLIKKLGSKYDIIGFELLKALYASANEELVPVDVSSEESVQAAFKHIKDFYGDRIASVVHLAAYYSFKDQHYKKYKKITVEGTKHLLDALQDFHVDQFIFSSTMLVHKPNDPNGKRITERSPKVGRWAYPRSKIETEEVIHKHRGKIRTCILRISGVYDDLCHSIPISNQIQRIYEGQLESHLFPGDTSHGASFMHMDDLVDAIIKCIERRKKLPEETVMLLGEEETLSTDEMQKEISQIIKDKSIFTWRIPKFVAWIGAWFMCHNPFGKNQFIRPWMIRLADDNYTLDISRAKKLLKWEPKHNLRDDLETMIKNLQKNPLAWYHINGLTPPKHLEKQWKRKKRSKEKSHKKAA